MPFKSKAQRRWMMSQHPEMAKEWEKMTDDKKLPERVKPKKKAEPSKSENDPHLDFGSLVK
jgi:hypothetical protein